MGARDHSDGRRRQCDYDVKYSSSYRRVAPRIPTVTMTMPGWAKGTLLLALTLATGIALGVTYEQRRTSSHARSESHHMIDRLNEQLGLDSEQRAAIAAIFARRQHSVDSTWHELQPHVRATMDSTLREVSAVLRPEQVVKFRGMIGRLHPGALP